MLMERYTDKSRVRVAIVHQAPVYNDKSGGGNAINFLAYLTIHALECNVRIFSIGKDNFNINYHINEAKVEEVVNKGFGGINQGKLFNRILDGVSLILFNSYISESRIAANDAILYNILNYKPDIIIFSSYSLSSLIFKMMQKLPEVKTIAYTDSYKQIYLAFNAFSQSKLGKLIKVLPPLFLLIKKRYINHNLKIFSNLVKLSDCIIFPANRDELETIRYFKIKKSTSSIPVLPMTQTKQKSNALRFKKTKSLKKHLKLGFLGTYEYLPNREAIDMILDKIAPKLPNNEFIIAGSGLPLKSANNIKMIGFVNNIDDFFSTVDIFIAPLISGVGIKTKLFGAIEKSKPIIGTDIAFSGYNAKNQFNCIIENDVNKFSSQIKNLEENKRLYKKLMKNAYTLTPEFSEQIIKIKKIIEKITKNPKGGKLEIKVSK